MLLSTRSFSSGKLRSAVLFALVSTLFGGCHSTTASSKPALQITQVPAANPGGPVQLDFIEGRVTGAKPGQQIILYAYSGIWWLQPFATHQSTNIQPDSTWRNSTHLGTQYAACPVITAEADDLEMSRWGLAASKNAQYVVQPFYVPENISRFMAPAGRRWQVHLLQLRVLMMGQQHHTEATGARLILNRTDRIAENYTC